MRIFAALCSVCAFAPSLSQAQDYPAKPVRLILPATPGGAFELYGRVMAGRMSATLGRPVVAENRPGASGTIGVDFVAKSAPDGYTLLWSVPASTVTPLFLLKSLPFDPKKDFIPISIGSIPLNVMVADAAKPFSSVRELVEYGKRNPGKLFYGSSGTGSYFHFMGVAFNRVTGVGMEHVPYKGPLEAINDVVAGRIDATFTSLGGSMPFAKAGKLRVIAVLNQQRYPTAPEVPTFAEVLPAYDVPRAWYSMFAPAGTPGAIVTRIYTEMAAAVKSEESRKFLDQYFMSGVGNTPEEFARIYQNDFVVWEQIIKAAGVKLE